MKKNERTDAESRAFVIGITTTARAGGTLLRERGEATGTPGLALAGEIIERAGESACDVDGDEASAKLAYSCARAEAMKYTAEDLADALVSLEIAHRLIEASQQVIKSAMVEKAPPSMSALAAILTAALTDALKDDGVTVQVASSMDESLAMLREAMESATAGDENDGIPEAIKRRMGHNLN